MTPEGAVWSASAAELGQDIRGPPWYQSPPRNKEEVGLDLRLGKEKAREGLGRGSFKVDSSVRATWGYPDGLGTRTCEGPCDHIHVL